MEQIALERKNQRTLKRRVHSLKKKIISGEIKIRKTNKPVKRKSRERRSRGVVYIRGIPHGFYEDQMKEYFGQFGTVTRVMLARSKKTGKSKGCGYVEFYNPEIAEIVAETMNNYLMFNCIMKCKSVPPEDQNERMFANKTFTEENYPRLHNRLLQVKKKNKIRTEIEEKIRQFQTLKQIDKFKDFFENQGIQHTFKVHNPEESRSINTQCGKSMEKNHLNNAEENYGVLEIDESDNEIQFKTPPLVKKVSKRKVNLMNREECKNEFEKMKDLKKKEMKSKPGATVQRFTEPKIKKLKKKFYGVGKWNVSNM